MAEQKLFYRDQILRMSDDPVTDFLISTEIATAEYAQIGCGSDLLKQHSIDIRSIQQDLVDEHMIDSNAGEMPTDYWEKMLGLAFVSREVGSDFINSFIYGKLTRFLAVEYGPDETPTTQILRKIGSQAIKRQLEFGDDNRKVSVLTDTFSSFVELDIYGDIVTRLLHPELREYLGGLGLDPETVKDPALARLISTARYKGDIFVLNGLDQKFTRLVELNNSEIFQDVGSRTAGAKKKVVIWDEIGSSVAENDYESSALSEQNVVEDFTLEDSDELDIVSAGYLSPDGIVEGEDLSILQAVIDRGEFLVQLANCAKGADSFKTVQEHFRYVKRMNKIMFPERGASTKQANEICNDCSVRVQCLAYAIKAKIKFGFWGGQSERSRRVLRRALSVRAATPSEMASSR